MSELFSVLDLEQGFSRLVPVYDYLQTHGGKLEGEYIVVDRWPVQFLPPADALDQEALREAVETLSQGKSRWRGTRSEGEKQSQCLSVSASTLRACTLGSRPKMTTARYRMSSVDGASPNFSIGNRTGGKSYFDSRISRPFVG